MCDVFKEGQKQNKNHQTNTNQTLLLRLLPAVALLEATIVALVLVAATVAFAVIDNLAAAAAAARMAGVGSLCEYICPKKTK